MEIISSKQHTARKEHRCDYCNSIISVGQKYDSAFLSYDGEAYTWKSHLYCLEIVSELKMHEDSDDGVSSDDFQESILNEFIQIIDQNDVTKYTFQQQLFLVLDHYKINL